MELRGAEKGRAKGGKNKKSLPSLGPLGKNREILNFSLPRDPREKKGS